MTTTIIFAKIDKGGRMRSFSEIKEDYNQLKSFEEYLYEILFSDDFKEGEKTLSTNEKGKHEFKCCEDIIANVLNLRNISIVNSYSMINTRQGQVALADSLRKWTFF